MRMHRAIGTPPTFLLETPGDGDDLVAKPNEHRRAPANDRYEHSARATVPQWSGNELLLRRRLINPCDADPGVAR